VQAPLDKADAAKSKPAKRRTLELAMDAVRGLGLAPETEGEQIAQLTAPLGNLAE
jgi:hypothetical protein